jgi:PhnB protein
MKLIPYLMFTKGQCRDAFTFYAEALRGEVVSVATYGDMPGAAEHMPPASLSRVANAHLVARGASIMGSDNVMGGDAADSDEGRNDTTVNVEVDSVEEADRVFAALSAGGKIEMPLAETEWARRFGMFTDRYGKPWMVNCLKPTD